MDHVQNKTNLDVIAITDHETIQGGLIARELAAQHNYKFDVIVGTEITTLQGHLLAYFVEKPIPSWRPIANTIEAIHSQGGLCVVPHPLSWLTTSVGKRVLDKAHNGGFSEISIDGLETSNPTMAAKVSRSQIRDLNHKIYRLPETGGSDAHEASLVGQGRTLFQGTTAKDLKQALVNGKTTAIIVPPHKFKGITPWKAFRVVIQGLAIHPSRLVGNFLRNVARNERNEHRSGISI